MLVTCSDCYKQISDSADTCPFCGKEDAGTYCVEHKAHWADQREKRLRASTERCKEAIGKVVKMRNSYGGDERYYYHYHGKPDGWLAIFGIRKHPEHFYFRITEIKSPYDPDGPFAGEMEIGSVLIGETLCCGEKLSIKTAESKRALNFALFEYLFEEAELKSPLWEDV